MNYTLSNYSDNTFELVIFCNRQDFEAARELFPILRRKTARSDGQRFQISLVRLVLAGGMTILLSMSQLAAALKQADEGQPLSQAIFAQAQPKELVDYLNQSQGAMNVLSPAYFSLHPTQGLVLSSQISADFNQAAAAQKSALMPMVTYEYIQPERIYEQVQQIADGLRHYRTQYRFDGYTLDIRTGGGEALTQFVSELKAALGEGASLSIIVHPQQYDYQYRELAGLCDVILVNPLPDRPSSSASSFFSAAKAEQILQQVLAAGLPRAQTGLAISFGGRLWGPGFPGNLQPTARELAEIKSRFTVRERYDAQTRSTFLTFTIKFGQVFYVGGQRLYPGDYTVNEGGGTYARELLALVHKYDLHGAATIGAPLTPGDLWDYYTLWLGSGYFDDVATSYARDDIVRAAMRGILKGVDEHRFAPFEKVTRAQAAVILSRMLSLPEARFSANFPDASNHWASKEIQAAVDAGLIRGYQDGTFRPDRPLTRAEAATLVYRLCGLPYEGQPAFSDTRGHWAQSEIAALAKVGILRGYEDQTFRPDATMSREEIATVVERVQQYLAEGQGS